MSSVRQTLAISIAAVLASGLFCNATGKPLRQLSRDEVAVTWVGLSDDELYMFRVALHADGSGVGSFRFVDDPVRRFRIQEWSYELDRISIRVDPVEAAALGFAELRGTLRGWKMVLTLSGRGYEQKISLRQEAHLERRWELLRATMSSE